MHILPRIFTKDFTTITVYLQWLRRITEGGGETKKEDGQMSVLLFQIGTEGATV